MFCFEGSSTGDYWSSFKLGTFRMLLWGVALRFNLLQSNTRPSKSQRDACCAQSLTSWLDLLFQPEAQMISDDGDARDTP